MSTHECTNLARKPIKTWIKYKFCGAEICLRPAQLLILLGWGMRNLPPQAGYGG